MNCIVTADANWAIGYKGKILVSIPADQRFFRDATNDCAVVFVPEMIDEFPAGRPVPGRKNIILAPGFCSENRDCVVVSSREEALREMEGFPEGARFCVGRGRAVAEFFDLCDTCYVTKLEDAYTSDEYMEDLDHSEEFEMVSESDEQTCHDIIYTRRVYKRKK